MLHTLTTPIEKKMWKDRKYFERSHFVGTVFFFFPVKSEFVIPSVQTAKIEQHLSRVQLLHKPVIAQHIKYY